MGGDHGLIRPGDRVLLIVERDPTFAQILLQTAHEQGLKALIVSRGETALALAREVQPAAITLDLSLPDLHGWKVLQRLKDDPRTRHIPVHIISGDESGLRGVERGAVACLKKPVSKKALDEAFANMKGLADGSPKHLLVVEDNEIERDHVVKMVGDQGVRITAVGTGAEALAALRAQHFDCLVLDLRLPDVPGTGTGREDQEGTPPPRSPGHRLHRQGSDPGGRDSPAGAGREGHCQGCPLAGSPARGNRRVPAPGRGRSGRARRPRRSCTGSPPSSRDPFPRLRHPPSAEAGLAGKKILIVDDDVRNLFALMSMLEHFQVQVLRAESGREALQTLEQHPDVDLVLMDIMMPGMDGYETTRTIRKQDRFRSLPIIALTAKAMKGDREKCLEAGTSDYLAKPVSSEQLLTVLNAWLSRPQEVVGTAG